MNHLNHGSSISRSSRKLPFPASGDTLRFVPDVESFLAAYEHKVLFQWLPGEKPFAIAERSSDAYEFILQAQEGSRIIHLLEALPSFDSATSWSAISENDVPYYVSVDYSFSARTLIPEPCRKYLAEESFSGFITSTRVTAYNMTDCETIKMWRRRTPHPNPEQIFRIVQRLANTVQAIQKIGIAMMRFSPQNVIISDEEDTVQFVGMQSLGMPWDEQCAQVCSQPFEACTPPECFGYLKHSIREVSTVYVLGAIMYFLIANTIPPVCEAMGFETAILPRAYSPWFPLGWDEIIMRALNPNPDKRYATVEALMTDFSAAFDEMKLRRDAHGAYRYDAAIDTHIGIAKRIRCPVNQDAVFLRQSNDGKRILLVVGDGVSTATYGSGDIASGLLLQSAEDVWNRELRDKDSIDAKSAVDEIFRRTNKAISDFIWNNYADKSPNSAECMGTTALTAIIEDGVLTLGSIGDSRAYIIRDHAMMCITRDHNLFTFGIASGLSVNLCASHPHAGSLVQCLGYYDPANSEIPDELSYDIFVLNLLPEDRLLLTTDGILDYIAPDLNQSEEMIADIVLKAPSCSAACLELIVQANMGGGGDNCGVGLIHVCDPAFGCNG